MSNMKDALGRTIDYMRISVTDRCNLRCKYCMPYGVECVPRWDILSLEEIRAVKAACHGKLLKVIIETCMLTDAEKIEMCRVVSDSGAEYIKTSTGFGGGGATREDVALFKAHVAPHVKIKAAGGIADLNDARDFVALGADRLGTSRIVKAVKAMEQE